MLRTKELHFYPAKKSQHPNRGSTLVDMTVFMLAHRNGEEGDLLRGSCWFRGCFFRRSKAGIQSRKAGFIQRGGPLGD